MNGFLDKSETLLLYKTKAGMAAISFPKKKRMNPTKGRKVPLRPRLFVIISLYCGFHQIWAKLFNGLVVEDAVTNGKDRVEKSLKFGCSSAQNGKKVQKLSSAPKYDANTHFLLIVSWCHGVT